MIENVATSKSSSSNPVNSISSSPELQSSSLDSEPNQHITGFLLENLHRQNSSNDELLRTSNRAIVANSTTSGETRRAAFLSGLNRLYESMESTGSSDSWFETHKENPELLLRALTFASDRSFDFDTHPELGDNLGDCIERIPSRFFENQSAAKGVNVAEVRKMHSRQLHLQKSFERDFDHDLWEELAAKSEISKFHTLSLNSRTEQNTPRRHSHQPHNQLRKSTFKERASLTSFSLESLDAKSFTQIQVPPEIVTSTDSVDDDGIDFPKNVSPIQIQTYSKHCIVAPSCSTNEEKWTLTTAAPLGLLHSRKLSCPQINFESYHSLAEFRYPSSGVPESGSEYLALMGSLLSELDPASELNQLYFIEIALVSSVQSLKLSLDFYRYFMFYSNNSTDQRSQSTTQQEIANNRLNLQNLYLDTLEVESMLYECLDRFRHNKGRAFAATHIQKLQRAVQKMNDVQQSLHRFTSSSTLLLSAPSCNRIAPN